MRNNDGYCSLQEYNDFKVRIFDAIDEWQNYWDEDDSMGIAVDPTTHEIKINTQENATAEGLEWFALPSLIDEEGNADVSAVLDIVDSFCFLR